MNSAQALYTFWSGYNWQVYDAYTVPSEDLSPALPRITYESASSEFDEQITLSASLWDRSFSWQTVEEKAEQIYNDIGAGGKIVPFEGGALWITRGTPFAQRMSDTDDAMRRIVLQIQVEFFKSN